MKLGPQFLGNRAQHLNRIGKKGNRAMHAQDRLVAFRDGRKGFLLGSVQHRGAPPARRQCGSAAVCRRALSKSVANQWQTGSGSLLPNGNPLPAMVLSKALQQTGK
jgi:hypothetical protein